MVKKAAEFARKVHEGKLRKGSMVPYIVHPFEAAVIVSGMTDDPEVISAALLHDVIEDAGISYEELKMQFGSRVADLVLAESEDKSRTWKERKSATIEKLRSAGRAEKLICLGDKLSNLRSTAADMLLRGDGVWQKFRVTDKNVVCRTKEDADDLGFTAHGLAAAGGAEPQTVGTTRPLSV